MCSWKRKKNPGDSVRKLRDTPQRAKMPRGGASSSGIVSVTLYRGNKVLHVQQHTTVSN